MIIFIADFFKEQVLGGGELANDELIKRLSEKKYDIVTKRSHEVTTSFIEENADKFFIVANFTHLSREAIERLQTTRYVIYEHDHKYIRTRDPSKYEDYIVPEYLFVNKDFYKNAKSVLCQSKIHAETVSKNLLLGNIVNLGCSLWSEEVLNHIESLSENKKEKKISIVKSGNKIKGTLEAVQYCKEKKMNYELISSADYKDFMKQLSQNDTLMFFSHVLESFCRLAVEARMLGCKVITNKNTAAAQEPWFKLKGKELIKTIRENQERVVQTFVDIIEERKIEYVETYEIPKISLITSVYNGDDFIEGFLEDITQQTIFDKCELILINPNSPGNEEKIIKKYLAKYDNIVYKKIDHDPGVYGVWNLGIQMSTGEYISNANIDDRRAPQQLEGLAKYLMFNENIDLVYSECFMTDVANENYINNSSNEKVYITLDFAPENMIKCLPGPMPLWRKTLHDKAGKFNEEYKFAGDWDMWLKAVRCGSKFKKVEGVYGLYYNNPEGLSTDSSRRNERFLEEKAVFYEYEDVFGEENFNKFKGYFLQ